MKGNYNLCFFTILLFSIVFIVNCSTGIDNSESNVKLGSLEAVSAANPVIDSVDPTPPLTHNSSYTIVGESFGDKSPAHPIMYDNFEAGDAENKVTIHNTFPTVADWPWDVWTPENVVFENNNSHGGSQSVFIDATNDGQLSFGWANHGPYDQLYISWWKYHEADPADVLDGPLCNDPDNPNPDHCHNHKLLYVFANAQCVVNTSNYDCPQYLVGAIMSSRQNWHSFLQGGTCDGGCTDTFYGWQPRWDVPVHFLETLDQWQRWDTYIKKEDPYDSNNGITKTTFQGQVVALNEEVDFHDVPFGWDDVRMGAPVFRPRWMYDVFRTWMDDVYIDNTRARIEICDQSEWNESVRRHCELQIPEEWYYDDGQGKDVIVFKANQGSFSNGQNLWLYVVDRDGNASVSGYPVTFETTGMDTVPPYRSLRSHDGDELLEGTVNVEIFLRTNEPATCRYSTNPDTAYEDMSLENEFIASDGDQLHTKTIEGLSDGDEKYFYVRCIDVEGNANKDDYIISFGVGVKPKSDDDTTADPPLPTENENSDGISVSGCGLTWAQINTNVSWIIYLILIAPIIALKRKY